MRTDSTETNLPSETGGTARPLRWGRFFLFLLIAALVTGADLGTKRFFFDRLGFPSGNAEWVVRDVFGFQTSLNPGALWGVGARQTAFLSAVSFAALAGVLFWLRAEGGKSLVVLVSLALIAGGILGNLWDRLALHGITWPPGYADHIAGTPIHAVRDWILVMIGTYHWPNFNIADAALVCGVALMILRVLLTPAPKRGDGEKGATEQL